MPELREWLLRRIAMAAPTCTLWKWSDYEFAFLFRPWPRLRLTCWAYHTGFQKYEYQAVYDMIPAEKPMTWGKFMRLIGYSNAAHT